MINKLKLLGRYVYENEGDQNPYALDNSLKKANVILLDFTLSDERCSYNGTDTMQFDQSKNRQLLVKKAPGQEKSEFPTYFLIFNRDEEKLRDNIRKSIDKLSVTLGNNAAVNPELKPLDKLFQKKSKGIINEVFNKINPDESNLCSIRIKGKMPGDSEFYKPILKDYLKNRDRGYYKKYNTVSLGKNTSCYLCGNISEKIYGFCSPYKFYSSNENAYIASGFVKELSWKNFPVCHECALHLRLGKELIGNHFNRSFYGSNYFLIPALTLNRGDFYEMVVNIKEDFRNLSLKKNQESNQGLRNDMEDEVFETLAGQKDQATFTFFFYAASQSEFKILQEAEDILPSRFQRIIEVKNQVENHKEFKELKGLYKKGEDHNLLFNFGVVRTFFHPKKKNPPRADFTSDFLDITAKILKDKPISKQFIIHRISDYIAREFRRDSLFSHDIRKAMIFMKFLYKLNLIEKTKAKMEVDMNNKYENHFRRHPEFYDADWKKAVFLTGVLSQHVMDIQFKERNATPFRSRLNGLKIDPRILKRLLPEAINKLEQYKKNYYRKLEEIISKLLESGEADLCTKSVDEISFYFVMGINLNKQFKSKEEKEGGNNG